MKDFLIMAINCLAAFLLGSVLLLAFMKAVELYDGKIAVPPSSVVRR